MSKNTKVSIIVGCYNVAKWLREGRLQDIYSQTYEHWELILVDDGSTDDTPKLLDAEAKKDVRIRVIHKQNGGLGSARNAALEVATGYYVWSYDVDDHVDNDCIAYCVNEMEARQLDVLMFGFHAVTPSLGTSVPVRLDETMLTSNDEVRDNYIDKILFVPNGNGFFWNKFYKRSFIELHHLRFGNQRIQQDEVFNLNVYKHLQRCYLSPRIFYHYYIYSSGNNRSKFLPDRFDIYKSVRFHFEELKAYWNLHDERLDSYLDRRFYQSVLACMLFNLTHPRCTFTKAQKREEMHRIMSDALTLQAFAFAERSERGVEQRLYRWACRKESLSLIRVLVWAFAWLRKIFAFQRNVN